ENGGLAWQLSSYAKVVNGNEPYYVNAAGDHFSLSLPAGSTATSPAMCVAVYYPTIRMFAMNTGDPRSTLRVDVLYKSSSGKLSTQTAGRFTGTGQWAPSPVLRFNAG